MPSTSAASSMLRVEVCPPSLRQAPDSLWDRALFWLMAPAPQQASLPTRRLHPVRVDFRAATRDLSEPNGSRLRGRIDQTQSLRDLWHLRTDIYHAVALELGQHEADQRLLTLNRHFPTRAPRRSVS